MNPFNRMNVFSGLKPMHQWMSAKLWRLALICAVVGATANLHAGEECEDKLQGHLIEKTRFVDVDDLGRKSGAELSAMLPPYLALQRTLEVKLAQRHAEASAIRESFPATFSILGMAEQIALENSSGLRGQFNQIEELKAQGRSVAHYLEAIRRALGRTHNAEPAPAHSVPAFDISVTGKTATQVMSEVTRITATLPLSNAHQALRFFPSASEDLARRYGTDVHGRQFGDETTWDQFGLEALLSALGLNADDGFYGLTYEQAVDSGLRGKNGEKIPFEMVHDFMRGERSLEVYDLKQLEAQDADFFIFKNPARKLNSLLAIIRPRH
jgi:hypothetical protein